MELAFSSLLLSRPFLGILALIGLIISLVAGFNTLAGWSIGLVLALLVYLLTGIFLVEAKGAALKATLHIPVYAAWQIYLLIKSLFTFRKVGWTRTERK